MLIQDLVYKYVNAMIGDQTPQNYHFVNIPTFGTFWTIYRSQNAKSLYISQVMITKTLGVPSL